MAAIDLTPAQWGLATWRPLAPPPTDRPRPFDAQRLRRDIKAARNEWGWWRWRSNPLPAVMTPEEGAFWLRAAKLTHGYDPAEAAEYAFAPEPLEPDEAFLYAIHTQLPYGEAMQALVAVMDPAEIAERMVAPLPPKPSWTKYGGNTGSFAAGVRVHLVPRLGAADLDRFGAEADALLRQELTDPGFVIGYEAELGAQLGCHEGVSEVVKRWPDRWFTESGGGSYATIALGLPSAEAFRATVERTCLLPNLVHSIPGFLAQLEEGAFEVIAESIERMDNREQAEQHAQAFGARVSGPEAVPVMLRLLRSSKATKPVLSWLETHSDGVPDDTPDGRRVLRRLGLLTEPDLPVHPGLGLTAPRRPPSAAGLPPLLLDGMRVSEVEAVLAALANDEPLPDFDNAEEFGWELFEGWLLEGAPAREKWRFTALGRLGGDATALRLGPLIRVWPGEAQHKRAVLGLDVLRAIGTDTALMQLNGIAQKLKYKALQERAREAMAEIAAELRLSPEQLEDRIVPDCGLDADGRRVFEDGSEFVLGADMKPLVRTPTGKLRAGKGPEWKLLRKQVAEVAKIQAERLEQAMVSQRRWPLDEFERLLVAHPLMRHLVRRLVWLSDAGAFRVTEENDYADANDEPFSPAGEVRLAHPLVLDDLDAWGEQFADYELVPPFPQLGRPVYDLEPGEADAREISRPGKVNPLTLRGILERAGWRPYEIGDGGVYRSHARQFADVAVIAEYEGIIIGDPTHLGEQAVERCYVLDGRRWGEVDPVVRSEVLATLEAIAQRA